MNTEEERKAFERQEKCNVSRNEKGNYSPGVQNRWAGWLAAKEHAAEMAKPTVKIIRSTSVCTRYPWVVSLFEGETFNGVLEDFTTKEDAGAWAHKNGYRVIE